MRQPNLAEGRWLWRRLYVFASSAAVWGLLAEVVRRAPPANLSRLADGLMGLLALMLILYLVAPTAQQIVSIVADLRLRLTGGHRR